MITKWKKFILTRHSYPSVIGVPSVIRKKMHYEKFYDELEDLRQIRKKVMNVVEEEKEEKYEQLEFEFDEDLVAPI